MEQTAFIERLERMGLGSGWEWKNSSWWLTADDFNPRINAQTMLATGARFVAITVIEREDHEMRLDYQWDLDGQLLSFIAQTKSRRILSITDLVPAADWAERETWEYFAVEFTGRPHTRPLMTRAGDAVGIHLQKEVAE